MDRTMDAGPVKRANWAEQTRRLRLAADPADDSAPDAAASAVRTLAASRTAADAHHPPPQPPSRPAGAGTGPTSGAPGSAVVHLGPRAGAAAVPADYTHLKLKPNPAPAARQSSAPATLSSGLPGQAQALFFAEPAASVPTPQRGAPGPPAQPSSSNGLAGSGGEAPFSAMIAPAIAHPAAHTREPVVETAAQPQRLPDRIGEIVVRAELRAAPARPRALAFALIVLLVLVYLW